MFKVLRLRQVIEMTGLSRSTIYEKIEAGTFPSPIKLSVRSVGWLEDTVQAWIQERVAQSQSGTGFR
jgi:prophage regulatory protein